MSSDIQPSRGHGTTLAKVIMPKGGHNGSANLQAKRKRDKAQEQLRSRMRQRRSDGNGIASPSLSATHRGTVRHTKRNTSLSAGMMAQPASVVVTPADLLDSNYMYTQWRTHQPDGPDPSVGSMPNHGGSTRRSGGAPGPGSVAGASPGSVPIQELVNRVLERRRRSSDEGPSRFPPKAALRAAKQRRVPYVIRHSSHIQQIVRTMSVREAQNQGVSAVEKADAKKTDTFHHEQLQRLGLKSTTEGQETVGSHGNDRLARRHHVPLPPKPSEKSARSSDHDLTDATGAAKDAVTTYRLRARRTSQGAEGVQPVNGLSTHKTNPLPPISATTRSSDHARGPRTGRVSSAAIGSRRWTSSRGEAFSASKKAKTDIGSSVAQECSTDTTTLLKTPRRFTSKTSRFKHNFERARQLSAIQEDRGRSAQATTRQETITVAVAGPSSISSSTSLRGILKGSSSSVSKDGETGG